MMREMALNLMADHRFGIQQRLLSTTRIARGSRQGLTDRLAETDQVILWLQSLPDPEEHETPTEIVEEVPHA